MRRRDCTLRYSPAFVIDPDGNDIEAVWYDPRLIAPVSRISEDVAFDLEMD
jgi:hypothetical protein